MEDDLPPEPQEDGIALSRAEEENRRELRAHLKETERLWDREGDSEALWERTHDLPPLRNRIADRDGDAAEVLIVRGFALLILPDGG